MHKRFSRKGFSLVEMLIVIAIIAVLVSIIVPTVTKTTTRSAAAANAANLRSVEGQLSTLRFTNPEVIENSLGQDVTAAANAIRASISGIFQVTPNIEVMRALSAALFNLEDRLVQNVFYGNDGKMQLNGMEIEAPAAKAISVDGINIRKTTQMEVVITDNAIVATYGGMTAAAFAAIAEEGDTGDYSNTPHVYVDANKDNICDICGGGYEHSADEIADGIIGGVVSGAHTCSDVSPFDHKCDDIGCGLPVTGNCTDAAGDKDHVCDAGCGASLTSCDKKSHDSAQHWCSECGENKSSHTFTNNVISGNHQCSCGYSEGHNTYEDGNATKCYDCSYYKYNGCVTPDTLITLADGSTKAVKDLTYNDQIIAWNHFTGEYQVTSASYIVYHGEEENTVITLYFSDGNYVEIVTEHGFFDIDANKFVFINEENVADFVGHGFVKQAGSGYDVVTMTHYTVETKVIGAYSIASIACNNAMANGMFSLTPMQELDSEKFYNFLVMGDNLKYDEAALAEDIATYGVFTYKDFADIMTEEQFAGFEASNGHYLKIAMEKGYCTFEQILKMLNPTDLVAAE